MLGKNGLVALPLLHSGVAFFFFSGKRHGPHWRVATSPRRLALPQAPPLPAHHHPEHPSNSARGHIVSGADTPTPQPKFLGHLCRDQLRLW
jgi:hypothetical protein